MGRFNWFSKRKSSNISPTNQTEQSSEKLYKDNQGRRYREDVPYALPKDLEEGQRLNLQHYVFRYFLQGNYAAPVPETISSILDVGSGTGIWGREMAQRFPAARVFGLDLESPQAISLAAQVITPPANYHYIQGNLLEGLPFPNRMFDFTHQRLLSLGIVSQKWPGAIKELARVTRPNGWVELLEIGGQPIISAGPATAKIGAWAISSMKARGIDVGVVPYLGDMLSQAGLHGVTSRMLDIPVGGWDNRLGTLMEKDAVAAFMAMRPIICANEHIESEHFDNYVRDAVKEWKHMKSMCRFYLAYGQV